MSDQTIEALGINDGVDPSEPSMEDILASIRRIIADDGDASPESSNVDVSAQDDHVDMRDYAAVAPEVADQNTVLIEAESPIDVDELNLEDILVLSDDDFVSEDLQIPAMESISDDLTDDLLIEVDDVLAAEFDDILENDTSVSSSSLFSDIDSKLSDIETGSSQNTLVDLVASDVEAPVDLTGEVEPRIDLSSDIDLILSDDDSFFLQPAHGDSSDILGIVEAGIADIEGRETAESDNLVLDATQNDDVSVTAVESSAAVSISQEVSLALDTGSDDEVIDLVGDLLANTDSDDEIETVPSVPEIDSAPVVDSEPVYMPSLETLSNEDELELDLVKSLMADLTDDSLIDEDILIDEIAAPVPDAPDEDVDPVLVSKDDEADLVDEILDLAIADELAVSDETTAQNERAATPEINLDETQQFSSGEEMLTVEDSRAPLDLDDIFSQDGESDDDDVAASVDASINSLLGIAALAERDALSVKDDLAPRISTASFEEEIAIDLGHKLEPEAATIITDDVDTALSPEAKPEFDEIDAIFAEEMADENDEKSGFAEMSAYDTILPASLGEDLAKKPEEPLVLTGTEDANEPSLTDGIFDSPIFDDSFDDFEGILPSEDVFSSEDILPADEDGQDAELLETGVSTKTPITIHPPLEQEPTEMPKLVAKDGIIDDVTEAAAFEAFASLNQVVEENTEYQESGPRIGDLVQAALKPMLKEWLDENLKGIVERAVSKEVKRISSGK